VGAQGVKYKVTRNGKEVYLPRRRLTESELAGIKDLDTQTYDARKAYVDKKMKGLEVKKKHERGAYQRVVEMKTRAARQRRELETGVPQQSPGKTQGKSTPNAAPGEAQGSWWSRQSTGTKVGIGLGGAAAVGAGGLFVSSQMQNRNAQ
jgi:hypothetical protein